MKKQGEEGFVLVVSLVLLVILALFGVFATRMATTEYQIAGNERVYTENFYRTESIVIGFAQEIQNEDATNLKNYEVLDKDNSNKDGLVSVADIENYDASDKEEIGNYLNGSGKDADVVGDDATGTRKVLAVDTGVPADSSLSITASSQVHTFDIFARSQENGTDKIIKVGLKRRY